MKNTSNLKSPLTYSNFNVEGRKNHERKPTLYHRAI